MQRFTPIALPSSLTVSGSFAVYGRKFKSCKEPSMQETKAQTDLLLSLLASSPSAHLSSYPMIFSARSPIVALAVNQVTRIFWHDNIYFSEVETTAFSSLNSCSFYPYSWFPLILFLWSVEREASMSIALWPVRRLRWTFQTHSVLCLLKVWIFSVPNLGQRSKMTHPFWVRLWQYQDDQKHRWLLRCFQGSGCEGVPSPNCRLLEVQLFIISPSLWKYSSSSYWDEAGDGDFPKATQVCWKFQWCSPSKLHV